MDFLRKLKILRNFRKNVRDFMCNMVIAIKENSNFYYSFDFLHTVTEFGVIFFHLQINFNSIINTSNVVGLIIIRVQNYYFLKLKIMIIIQLFFLDPQVM